MPLRKFVWENFDGNARLRAKPEPRQGALLRSSFDFNFLRRDLTELVGCQSVSVVKPHQNSADNSRGYGQREEPPGFRQTDNTHREQTDGNKQPNRMAGPESSAVISKRNEFSGRREVARILLKGYVTDGHGDNTSNNLDTL
jgi:hypothetical protein